MDRVYLDYAATTPMDPIAVKVMLPFFSTDFGNPSSLHYFGQQNETAVENARKSFLKMMGSVEYELVFTSGGTESDNLAIKGLFNPNIPLSGQKILISPVEHPAITNTCELLERQFGVIIDKLRVDNNGIIDLDDLQTRIDNTVSVVSVIWGNNEIGTINDVEKIASICREKGVPFHTDAVQAAAYLDINLEKSDIALVSFGAHKFYGPKGVGGLLKRKTIKLIPQNVGGSQENGLRAGTQNVPLIVGMQAAYELAIHHRKMVNEHLIKLRDMVIHEVVKNIPGTYLTGHPTQRLPNHASFVFEGVRGQDLVIGLDMAGFAVSSGSACKVGNPSPSEVLIAIGISENLAQGALRVTVGKNTNESEVRDFLKALINLVKELRKG